MTEPEFAVAQASGAISVSEPEETTTPSPVSTDSISQFIPLLTQLQSVQQCVSAAPTYIPQTFQDQIVFVFDGTNYYLYLYFNNQWNEFAVSGGGGSGVDSVLAGFGISLSGATGNVTITCTIDDATLPMSDITTNNVSTSQHGFAPKLPNDATKYLDGTGNYSTPSSSGGSFATSSGTVPNTIGLTYTTTTQTITQTVTHGLGTTPKLIILTISSLIISANGGPRETVSLYITFNNSGTAVAGVTLYSFASGGAGLATAGLATTFTNSAFPQSCTQGISLSSIGATTFDFTMSYSLNAGSPFTDGAAGVSGISYYCLG